MAQVERVGYCNQQTTVDDTGRWLEQAESNQTPTCKQRTLWLFMPVTTISSFLLCVIVYY